MSSADVQGELWGRAPQDWAELQESFSVPLWESMLSATRVGDGSRFLDAGCGAGGASLLARRLGASVTGLDASQGLLEVATERIPDSDFKLGDLEALPFPDGVFDAVIAASSIQYAEDLSKRLVSSPESRDRMAGSQLDCSVLPTKSSIASCSKRSAIHCRSPLKAGAHSLYPSRARSKI